MATPPETRGWQADKTLSESLQHMLDNEMSADVSFIIEPPAGEPDKYKTRIAAHKFVLAARSPVFEAMFSGNFAESSGDVRIVDAEVEPFKEMLRYMYTEEVTLTEINVLQLLNLAKKYILEKLMSKCTDFLDNKICVDNVFVIMNDAIRMGQKDAMNKCLIFCESNTGAVAADEDFLSISKTALLQFLKHDQLQLDQEEAILRGCLQWAEKKCEEDGEDKDKIRDVLGDCVYQIRYLQISGKKFATLVGKSALLTSEEMSLVFCYKLTNDSSYVKSLSDLSFNTTSRMIECSRGGSKCSRFDDIRYDKPEKIRIFVPRPVICMGIGVNSGPVGYRHDLFIKLTEELESTQLDEIQTSVKCTRERVIHAYFNERIRLEPNKQYVIEATTPEERTCYHTGYSNQFNSPHVEVTSRILQHPAPYVNTFVKYPGYVCSLLICTTN